MAFWLAVAVGAGTAYGQSTPTQTTVPPEQQKQGTSAAGDIGHGVGDAGKGVAKGTGKAAEGVGKGAGDLVTLHPVGAAENVGKRAGEGAYDVGKGAVKGTGKVAEGTGKVLAKPFHHGKKKDAAPPAEAVPPPGLE
jgi:hypothetical protein